MCSSFSQGFGNVSCSCKCISPKAFEIRCSYRNNNAPKCAQDARDAGIFGCHEGSLKTCPTALKGQFQGREKHATIALESVVDYNLWFWYASFGFPGTMNDINIWERSSLLESMLNGEHESLDHEYTLDGKKFNKLFYLVDGIYPSLSRFL